MKICVSSLNKEKNAKMDQHFGRCPYFSIFDTETNAFEFLENAGVTANQGAGIAAGQQVIDEKVGVVITGSLGPNAMRVLHGGNIETYTCQGGSIEEVINLFQEGKLERLESAGPAHSGMGHK
ncbi:NifB/NifX family molybdenum-iron cluster-binding protein [Marinisporobacter balticus]|uniref:Putative Fe-Mo cluster-binding NifX family protein n=1 Tax=Marinisporobacter balticus TaxID=2018667 RepID=A0A4R2KQ37_9FIRM|nr:NifB/NifX family molybdenum-iron cluster-binding protein [Marinisporobacter balticus]TCO74812.1 putative Fe-Mo cluster-binding NifX family protein [Marinisporobacter balticus]